MLSQKFGDVKKTGIDLLDSLTQIRAFLENYGYLIFLNGARINVNASGLLRDSTNGISTYLLTNDFNSNKEVINIFHYCEKDISPRWRELVARALT